MRLVSASEMQEMDRLTIQELGIPGVVLMENAARGASRIFLEHFAPPPGARVLLLCGRGNNGGDGYVMARYLHQAGMEVGVIVLAQTDRITGDARVNLDIIRHLEIELREAPDAGSWQECRERLFRADYLIDGILGTGLNSPVRGFYREVIEEINAQDTSVTAIDIPSGLNADTGQAMGVAVKADLTVTFGLPKLGQVIFPGAEFVGRLARIDIGIPDAVSDRVPSRFHLTEPGDFVHRFLDESPDIHKGARGHLLVLAGSTGKTGAAVLTALGALRAGAGLVTVGVPEGLNPILENKLTEAMTFPLPQTLEGTIALEAEEEIERLMEGKSALAIGPGLSTHRETAELVRRILEKCPLPAVVDADALNALSGHLDLLRRTAAPQVLTPHPGEMARLTGVTNAEVQADRSDAVLRFVSQYPCCLVLKGARTLIAEPDGRMHVNPTGNPALSSGGSGDVLTGLIGGLLARGWPRAEAAVAGVYMHGLAADHLAEKMGQAGVFAGELLHALPGLTASLARGEWPLTRKALHEDFYHPL
ncbi:MAG: NAD(P)H-hydrate dehydratase [Deltaproteobacteria bacterium]|nr:NAD(P)H-hydrate dehydratase [Deltaproteobacteria bacterium]